MRLKAQGRQGRTYLNRQKLTPDDHPTNTKGVNIGSEKGVTVGSDLTSEFSDEAVEPVRETVRLAQICEGQGCFELNFREKFIKMMYRITLQLWPDDPLKGYSLYSCRHQASSNWKSVMPAVEVAALSGHAVPRTTQRHYGQKRSAWSKDRLTCLARPDPDEVHLINERLSMFQQAQVQRQLASGDGHSSDPAIPLNDGFCNKV